MFLVQKEGAKTKNVFETKEKILIVYFCKKLLPKFEKSNHWFDKPYKKDLSINLTFKKFLQNFKHFWALISTLLSPLNKNVVDFLFKVLNF